ncbi:hypothetical protein MGG_04907 [Pyricularia oryzae 70-15]|uniref:Uncharacterized protein n=1 Tax=Pyricularia oryzae (strain 70-15 / ATCC MYA-4617 / FGSC 8958) TaxID=242507 RepID=G4N2T2_PYRO7|nr:uncharacterized protein MGG_04907 [Pyricularia oryzae 70-15]EHA52587.1 hypothetical protein MGG_04907 [Pyricularia oryzae 70-15]KAI7930417.1 hypothetical protein M9X92_000854 [Pyricularia oryzae]KAI7932127.1 hypothetical protein M0657_000852 [Pyricularia oryzae]
MTYCSPHESYFDERPSPSEAFEHVPRYIVTLLTQLSPLHYVSLDLRHMTRAQENIFLRQFIVPSGRQYRMEIGLLRLACSDYLSNIILYRSNPAVLYGLQIDTGLEGAVYSHAGRLVGQTLRRLAIRLTSSEVDIQDLCKLGEYDRAFFPITSKVLRKILDRFPLLVWLTIDVATSIEEPWLGDLGVQMWDVNKALFSMHPKVEATIYHIAEAINRSEFLRRVALTWRGNRTDWLMRPGTDPTRPQNFVNLIHALGLACPRLEGIAFVTEYMVYYSGLRQNNGSLMVKPGNASMDRPGEWPAGLRGPFDYSEGVMQDINSSHNMVLSRESSTSASAVPNGGQAPSDATDYGELAETSRTALSRIAERMLAHRPVTMQTDEEDLLKRLYSERPGFGLQTQSDGAS